MNDLLGPVLVTIRDFPAVATITTRVRGGELAAGDTAPAVVIVRLSNTPSPFGPGHGRIGLQGPRYGATVYATTYQQAAQLVGAVHGALHNLSARTVSGKGIHQVIVDSWSGPTRDQATGWARDDVTFQVTGSA